MPEESWFIPMAIGGFFILFGLVMLFWGRSEEKSYYDSFVTRVDVREFLERWPDHPEPGALKLGGWVAIIVGLFMLALGGFMLWG